MHWRDRPKRPKKRTPTSVLAPFLAGYDVPHVDPSAIPNQNMGNIQKMQPGWMDHGDGDGLHGPEKSERQERIARGKSMKACYYTDIGEAPRLPAGDREGARLFLNKVNKAIEAGGWTRSERMRLQKLKEKWQSRAAGLDDRFSVVGNKSGGLTHEQEKEINRRKGNRAAFEYHGGKD